ncbi:uncharacterized protein NECHADRAFT_80127 [Fusarium vanettenii 77-13-4]|uniref:F-box domain-containing protein n=1 Tax=Fusarium vanettenii (strain ATCC MYA-4622 / CBS 123669 / FGSC 9596 / NRRL 45880 / 77-13-4) TaxID=660122 RepID=C7Z163_FUSV7|nr:uncharacterized protein NECHADRAFT_80127 [Fusarium vanettenii 77-13-4]EEU42515.1 hypothetical protein NECHADRAFT_80127 [Fusarium vanettenii 77-13-4]
MGGFHVYCVICGATTTEVEIGPREQPGDDEDVYMENRYDEDVIGDEDMEWFRQARLLGFNPDASGANKFYVSGAGEYLGAGIFDVDEGSEPDSAIEDFDLAGVRAWGDCDGEERGFPFHRQCHTVLARVLTGTEDTGKINRAVLYKIFGGLISGKSRCSDLDYGHATQGQDQTWEAIPGYEYTVINPEKRESLVQDILEVIQDEKFVETPSNLNLGHKVRWDPLREIPESLLRDILDLVDNESIFSLCKASWVIFELIRHSRNFWESRIRKNTPYFEELGETITTRRESLGGQDLRKILLWAKEASKPRVGISGLLMAVANRRRIWGVCEQIARRYHAECPDPDSEPSCKMESIAVCNKMHFVGFNVKPVFDTQRSYWIRSWDEYDADRPWTLRTFWNSDWDMTGISVSFGDEEPRMFGKRGTEEGAWETSKEVAPETWLRGFVFHLWPTNPLLEWEHAPWNYISVKGITIYFYDGFPVSYGDTGDSLMQRPLFAAEDMVIVGVEGQLAEKEGVTPWILRFGLLQAYPGDEEKPDPGYYPEVGDEEQMSWSSASLALLGKPSWESESLKFICDGFDRVENIDIDRELIPLRILMLGNRPNELANIRSISACINSKVTNIRVSFVDGQQTRTMREVDEEGFLWPEENWEEFEIDGPGGEIIDEIGWIESYDRSPELLHLRTNRNRTVLFALDTLVGENNSNTRIKLSGWTVDNNHMRVIKAEEGDVIVGIVMGFGQRESDWLFESDREEFGTRPWTYETFQKRSESRLFSYFNFVGALTMAKDA